MLSLRIAPRDQNWHIRKVGPETRDCWWDPRPEPRDPSHKRDPCAETQYPKDGTKDPIAKTWDARPRILKVQPETRNPKGGT